MGWGAVIDERDKQNRIKRMEVWKDIVRKSAEGMKGSL